MHILDIEQKTGLDRATIRFYEKENLVVPKRESNGYRVYSEDDLQLLLKIKLLRQLSIPLTKIKDLQQGSANFAVVLQEQISCLDEQLQKTAQAKLVCSEIQKSGATFSTMDTERYLKMLETPAGAVYKEAFCKESHPVRRFIARTIDVSLLSAVINFIIIVVLRIRPIPELLITIVGILSYIAMIPIEAVLLHNWGTTPGKWALGIHVDHINGGKLSFHSALTRGLYIIRYGYGFGIPIWMHWRLYRSYKEGEENPWNDEAEIIYTNWKIAQKVSMVVLTAISITLRLLCGFDAVLPENRGDLTIPTFRNNYQMYEKMFGYGNNQYYLQNDGDWGIRDNSVEITVTDSYDNVRKNFTYTFNGKNITGVHFQDEWQNGNFLDTMPYYCKCAMFAVVGSRPGCTYEDLIRLEGEIATEFYGQFAVDPDNGTYTGEININDVQIAWSAELKNVDSIYNGILYSQENVSSTYSLELDIQIAD